MREKIEFPGRFDRSVLADYLKSHGTIFKSENAIVCPFHDDENPSGSIYKSKTDGVYRFKCFGCSFEEDIVGVISKMENKSVSDVLGVENTNGNSIKVNGHVHNMNGKAANAPSVQNAAPKEAKRTEVYPSLSALKKSVSNASDFYEYTNPDTKAVEMLVVRIDVAGDKIMFQCRPEPDGTWIKRKPEGPTPLFNRGRLKTTSGPIFVVEGEKCVKALTRLGFTATTSSAGADQGQNADWSPLSGKSDVILWPDFDEIDKKKGERKGYAHMKTVQGILEHLESPPGIRWFDPEPWGLPKGGDAVDFIELHGGDDDHDRKRVIRTVIDAAEPVGGSADLEQALEKIITGQRKIIPLPWSWTDRLSQALLPGTILCICSDPGAGKSLMTIQAATYWHEQNVKVAVYMLEESRDYHTQRALAQLENNSELTNSRWIADHPAESRAAYAKHKKFLEGFSRTIYAAPDKQVDLEDVSEWVEARAKDGCEVIVVDPITAADAGDKRYIEDLNFIFRVKAILRKHPNSRVVITTHPKNGAKAWGDMAGGAAYPRFSQTVFWIHAYAPSKQLTCENWMPASGSTRASFSVNRSIRLGKTRNGRGAGMDIAFDLDRKSLRFFELGIIKKPNDRSEEESEQQHEPDPFA